MKRNIAIVLLSAVLVTSCDDSPKHRGWEPPSPGSESRICMDGAARKNAELKRPYPQFDGGYGDAYLGDTFLRVPLGYLHSIDGGGYPRLMGKSVIFEAYLPDLSPRSRDAGSRASRVKEGDKPNNVTIYVHCLPPPRFDTVWARYAANTEAGIVEEERDGYRRVGFQLGSVMALPKLGLRVFPLLPGYGGAIQDAIYFAADKTMPHPNGGIYHFRCHGDPEARIRTWCQASFLIRPNISVRYNFPYQQLEHWRKLQPFVYSLVKNSIKE